MKLWGLNTDRVVCKLRQVSVTRVDKLHSDCVKGDAGGEQPEVSTHHHYFCQLRDTFTETP